MKKIILLVVALMLMSLIVACDAEITSEVDDKLSTLQSEVSALQSEVGSYIEETEKETMKTEEVDFSEIVVVDNDECVIKITGIEPDNLWGYTLKALLENKSADKTYMFAVDRASVNGVQCDPLFATEVAAGKKSNEEISFLSDELEENGVGDYTDIELSFRVYDSNDWLADAVATETVHVYPYGEDKVVKYVRETKETDNIIVDNEFVTVVVTGYEHDSIWGYTANLFIVNKTDNNMMISADEVSVNGFMVDPFYATSVSAGKCAFSSMSWMDTTLEENGITDINEIEFRLRAYNEDDWFADDFANELITLVP